jgi:hypothetical protein
MLCRFPSTKYSLHFVWLNGNSLWFSKYQVYDVDPENEAVTWDSKVWNDQFIHVKISSTSSIHRFEELVPTDMSGTYHFGINGTGKQDQVVK